MTIQTVVQLGTVLGNMLFFAGGAWFLIKQLKKELADVIRQVNGIGAAAREHRAIEIAMEGDPVRRLDLAKTFFGVKR